MSSSPPFEINVTTGWLDNVRQVPSPNCDDRPVGASMDLLVIHGISLPPGQYGGSAIDAFFSNTLNPDEHAYFKEISDLRVSAHVLVARNGMLTQYVPFTRRAWHAGDSEFEGRDNCNDYSIGIELEGADEQPYEDRQYAALVGLASSIMNVWPEIGSDRIVGHCDVSPGRKTDPGAAFDWPRFRAMLSKQQVQ